MDDNVRLSSKMSSTSSTRLNSLLLNEATMNNRFIKNNERAGVDLQPDWLIKLREERKRLMFNQSNNLSSTVCTKKSDSTSLDALGDLSVEGDNLNDNLKKLNTSKVNVVIDRFKKRDQMRNQIIKNVKQQVNVNNNNLSIKGMMANLDANSQQDDLVNQTTELNDEKLVFVNIKENHLKLDSSKVAKNGQMITLQASCEKQQAALSEEANLFRKRTEIDLANSKLSSASKTKLESSENLKTIPKKDQAVASKLEVSNKKLNKFNSNLVQGFKNSNASIYQLKCINAQDLNEQKFVISENYDCPLHKLEVTKIDKIKTNLNNNPNSRTLNDDKIDLNQGDSIQVLSKLDLNSAATAKLDDEKEDNNIDNKQTNRKNDDLLAKDSASEYSNDSSIKQLSEANFEQVNFLKSSKKSYFLQDANAFSNAFDQQNELNLGRQQIDLNKINDIDCEDKKYTNLKEDNDQLNDQSTKLKKKSNLFKNEQTDDQPIREPSTTSRPIIIPRVMHRKQQATNLLVDQFNQPKLTADQQLDQTKNQQQLGEFANAKQLLDEMRNEKSDQTSSELSSSLDKNEEDNSKLGKHIKTSIDEIKNKKKRNFGILNTVQSICNRSKSIYKSRIIKANDKKQKELVEEEDLNGIVTGILDNIKEGIKEEEENSILYNTNIESTSINTADSYTTSTVSSNISNRGLRNEEEEKETDFLKTCSKHYKSNDDYIVCNSNLKSTLPELQGSTNNSAFSNAARTASMQSFCTEILEKNENFLKSISISPVIIKEDQKQEKQTHASEQLVDTINLNLEQVLAEKQQDAAFLHLKNFKNLKNLKNSKNLKNLNNNKKCLNSNFLNKFFASYLNQFYSTDSTKEEEFLSELCDNLKSEANSDQFKDKNDQLINTLNQYRIYLSDCDLAKNCDQSNASDLLLDDQQCAECNLNLIKNLINEYLCFSNSDEQNVNHSIDKLKNCLTNCLSKLSFNLIRNTDKDSDEFSLKENCSEDSLLNTNSLISVLNSNQEEDNTEQDYCSLNSLNDDLLTTSNIKELIQANNQQIRFELLQNNLLLLENSSLNNNQIDNNLNETLMNLKQQSNLSDLKEDEQQQHLNKSSSSSLNKSGEQRKEQIRILNTKMTSHTKNLHATANLIFDDLDDHQSTKFDNTEFEYGPGIVDKLKSRFLQYQQLSSKYGNNKLKRSSSLEDMLNCNGLSSNEAHLKTSSKLTSSNFNHLKAATPSTCQSNASTTKHYYTQQRAKQTTASRHCNKLKSRIIERNSHLESNGLDINGLNTGNF